MRRILPYCIYVAVLIIEILRVFTMAYFLKSSSHFISLFDMTGLALFCLPTALFFMILQNENSFHSLLNIIAFIKLFCIITAICFIIRTSFIQPTIAIRGSTIQFQTGLAWAFLPFDIFILIFSLLRERFLCK